MNSGSTGPCIQKPRPDITPTLLCFGFYYDHTQTHGLTRNEVNWLDQLLQGSTTNVHLNQHGSLSEHVILSVNVILSVSICQPCPVGQDLLNTFLHPKLKVLSRKIDISEFNSSSEILMSVWNSTIRRYLNDRPPTSTFQTRLTLKQKPTTPS